MTTIPAPPAAVQRRDGRTPTAPLRHHAADPAYVAEVLRPHQAPHPQSSADGHDLVVSDPDPERAAADLIPPSRWAEVGR